MDPFLKQKENTLNGLDRSRKGSVDAPIFELVNVLNKSNDLFTTSSCSGRICLYEHDTAGGSISHTGPEAKATALYGEPQRKEGCHWLLMTHETCTTEQVHAAAVSSGFRNSGITIGRSGKIITAVRSTQCLEVPVTKQGKLLVNKEYVEHLVQVANKKMSENLCRIKRFSENIQSVLSSDRTTQRDSRKKSKELNKKQTYIAQRVNGDGSTETRTIVNNTENNEDVESSIQNVFELTDT